MTTGLPSTVRVCLFDLDGVLTQTAVVHEAAWKRAFDEFLREESGAAFSPFTHTEYTTYVDGKPRLDGTRSFLHSRDINLPEGSADDPPTAHTIWGVSNKKNAYILTTLDENGVDVYPDAVEYLHTLRDAGVPMAVVTSSANAEAVLDAAGISDFFSARVDGVVAKQKHLPGKPAPDTFVYGASLLGSTPEHAAVFEDAISGVAAGRAGHFNFVVGVDRVNHADALYAHGADHVVTDITSLSQEG